MFGGPDLANIQLKRKLNKIKGNCFSLSVIDIFSKCAWVIPLKDKRVITITNAYLKNLNKSNHKPKIYGKIKAVNFATDQWYHVTW